MVEEKKRKTHTSTAVKRRYNQKAYDIIQFSVPKGEREKIKVIAASREMSLAKYLKHCIEVECAAHVSGIQLSNGCIIM